MSDLDKILGRLAADPAALVMGVIGGILPEGHARAERALAPLAGELEHAPSTLLAASR